MSAALPSAAAPNGQAPTEYREDLNTVLMCPDCKEDPPNLIEEFSSGDMVCASCGLVLGERIIDTRSEWRTFSNDDQGNDDPSRVGDGPNALLDGDQLETAIQFSATKSRNAKALTNAQNKMTQDKTSQALMAGYRLISNYCEKLNAGKNVTEAAKFIYKEVESSKLSKGKTRDGLVAGCIFVACRQLGVGRTFKEIHELTNVNKKEIGRVFKQLEPFLGKTGPAVQTPANIIHQQYDAAKGSTTAAELCERFCSKLRFRMAARIEKVARELAAQSAGVKDLAGRSPLSVAAACIYFACNLLKEERPFRDIAAVAGVSEGTVKTAYKHLLTAKDQVVKQEWLEPSFGGNMQHLPA